MLTKWFEINDQRFEGLPLPNVHLDMLFRDGRWLEGPVNVPADAVFQRLWAPQNVHLRHKITLRSSSERHRRSGDLINILARIGKTE